MANTTGTIKVPLRDVTQGFAIKVKMPRSFSLRMKIGAWLIGLAGRIMHMPCEVTIDTGSIKPGDVVMDKFTASAPGAKEAGRLMTVEYVHRDMCHCVWFERDTLHRSTFRARSLVKADAQDQ